MTLVHPREVFNPMIRDSAAAVIFLHNHPSGNPEPSVDDYNLTVRLAEAGKILGIRVMDHVVIGDGAFVSLRDRGAFREESGMSQAAENYGCREAPKSREEVPEEKVSTAILRNQAREAERNRDWKNAADLYRRAIENYPSDPATSALAKRDIELLTGSMKECLGREATERSCSPPQAGNDAKEATRTERRRSRDGMGF